MTLPTFFCSIFPQNFCQSIENLLSDCWNVVFSPNEKHLLHIRLSGAQKKIREKKNYPHDKILIARNICHCAWNILYAAEIFVIIKIGLPHLYFVGCTDKLCNSSLQQSNFHAYIKFYKNHVKTCKKCQATYKSM